MVSRLADQRADPSPIDLPVDVRASPSADTARFVAVLVRPLGDV